MKTITRSNIYLPMAAMILTAAIAVPAAAQKQVPFKGSLQGHDSHTGMPSPTTVLLATSCTGIGTHLGRFSLTQEVTVNIVTFTDTGSAHWVAANGDSIDTTLAGSAEPSDIPDLLKVTEIHTITGGTGRFAEAQGSFTVERLHNGVPRGDGTFFTSGSFHGTITSPGSAH
jgi:hypothetical protein